MVSLCVRCVLKPNPGDLKEYDIQKASDSVGAISTETRGEHASLFPCFRDMDVSLARLNYKVLRSHNEELIRFCMSCMGRGESLVVLHYLILIIRNLSHQVITMMIDTVWD